MNELRTTFEYYFPEGSKGGECAVFAERLEQFGIVGDTLGQKEAYVRAHGILRPALNGNYQIGDIVITNESSNFGHVFIINDIVGNELQATESNYHLDGKVTHGRIVPVSTRIYGVLRGCPLKVSIINPSLQKTFMAITLADNAHWATLQAQLDTLKQWFIHYSNNRFEPVFNTVETNFTSIPFVPFEGYMAPDPNWYRTNVTPLTKGQATLLLMPDDQWKSDLNTIIWGFMTYGDPSKPVRIQCAAAETEYLPSNTPGGYDSADIFVHRAFHEICHALFFLTGQPDRVHEFLLVPDDRRATLLSLIDYKKLQTALVKIK